jgi:argininosuccinate synthase
MSAIKKVVLAYSGGLDTSIMITWLKEQYDCEVIAFAADLGQGKELDGLEEKALKTGADKVYIEDLSEEFLVDYVWPTLRAQAVYEGKYLLGTSFARPLIAKYQVDIALKEGADAVAHGSTGKGNDQVRFELGYMALAPQLKIIAPWKLPEWNLTSREDAIDYANERNIPIPVSKEKIYSEDRNLWHISHEGGDLEDPWNIPSSDVFTMSNPLKNTPDEKETLIISFDKGRPVGVNNKKMGAVDLLAFLNKRGGVHGVGQIDIVENRLVGMKSRGVYETPGGSILYEAHRTLEQIVLDKDTQHYKQQISLRYADLVYNGQWFSPLREALDAFVDKTQVNMTGDVRVSLYKGNIINEGVRSKYSLYREDVASFGSDEIYNQQDADGFIRLFGLPLKVAALGRV